jgi:hypothetical protein
MVGRTLNNATIKSFSWIETKIVGIKNAPIERYHAISHKDLSCNFPETCYWLNRRFEFAAILQRQNVTAKDKSPMPRRLSENRSLLRKSGFWPIFPIKFVKYNKYLPHLIEPIIIKTADSKPLSLITTSILEQPPKRLLMIVEAI